MTISLTSVKLRNDPKWVNEMKDQYYSILRTLFRYIYSHNFLLDMKISIFDIYRKKFGELFYRVIIMNLKDHTKGMLIESAVLLGKIYLWNA